ncbi:uncharacterized protein H6S33_011184 [Morchella sextelata]|uniref:uncharacterized protein n=1 Tax=Morchella sextelata TaxID=1174677 RepID=UPI001D0479D6|nr:uncharacterized protein H6S33_011184 [Morchella sextelata]KAH0610757.1 hypothetical protein H6S33_011184 [Morchella sextelata]
MLMDPITPAATPPMSSPVEVTSCLGRANSLASVRSVFTLSVCSASATNDKTNVTSARCSHCQAIAPPVNSGVTLKDIPAEVTTAKDGELTPLEAPKSRSLTIQTSGPGFDSAAPEIGSATASLLKTLQDTNNELQIHCQNLHQIRLMNPSPTPSRRGSVCLAESEASIVTSSISTDKITVQGPGFQSGHPLICDLGDLVNLSNANFRLLKTLQDKVNKVDSAEKMLRTEREAIEREREQLKQMNAEAERERVRLMAGGLRWDDYKMSGARNHSVQGSRNVSGRATPEGNWDEEVEDSVFDEEWTEEKEQELKLLEGKLKKANRQWSDKQEEVLGPLERLREEKRQVKKANKLDRQASNKAERTNSREEQPEKPLRKNSGFKNSLSNIRRKSSSGSLTRRDSSPASGSATPTRLFRKWFP